MDAIKQLNYFFTEYPYAHMYDVNQIEVLTIGKEFQFYDSVCKDMFKSKVILEFRANEKVISSSMSFICFKERKIEITTVNAFSVPPPFKMNSDSDFQIKVISMFKTEDEMLKFKTKIKLML